MDLKEITEHIQDTIYHGEELSLPYIVSIEQKPKIGFFVFSTSDDAEEYLEITNVSEIILVDYDTTEIQIVSELPELNLPKRIEFETLVDVDDLDSFYDQYYSSLENYMKDTTLATAYQEAADNIIPEALKDIYRKLYAQLL